MQKEGSSNYLEMLIIMKSYTFWQIYNNEPEITIFSLNL